jgi:hypothetical protein
LPTPAPAPDPSLVIGRRPQPFTNASLIPQQRLRCRELLRSPCR